MQDFEFGSSRFAREGSSHGGEATTKAFVVSTKIFVLCGHRPSHELPVTTPGSRRQYVFDLWLDVHRLQAGSVPAPAKGLHEEHGGDQALALNDGRFLFVGQQDLLCADHVQIADESADITRCGDVQFAARRVNRVSLRLARGVEHLQTGDVVLDLAKSVEYGSAVVRDRRVVTRLR